MHYIFCYQRNLYVDNLHYFLVTVCDKPTIFDGGVSPSNATVDYHETYEVTCDTGFTISGSSTMTCGADGIFEQTSTCEGKIQTYFHEK